MYIVLAKSRYLPILYDSLFCDIGIPIISMDIEEDKYDLFFNKVNDPWK